MNPVTLVAAIKAAFWCLFIAAAARRMLENRRDEDHDSVVDHS